MRRYCLSGSVEVAQLLHQLALADGLRPEQLHASLAASGAYEDLLLYHDIQSP